MALAMAASTTFTACGSDDDDDEDTGNKVNTLSASVNDGTFSTSAAGFYQSAKGSTNTGTSVLSNIFSSSEGHTTIAGTEKGKQLAININGTHSGTYELSVASDQTINNALIELLSGGTVKDIISNSVKTDAMIIYRASNASEGDATYYFSTEARVVFNQDLVVYSTGTFTAKMRNKAGDTFNITDGSFKVFGKPSLN